jgi:hypothetical protein
MRIIKHFNPHFPDKDIYKCTIDNVTQYGDLQTVTEFRDDRLNNSDYYKELQQLHDEGCREYYKSKSRFNNYTGD